MAAGLDSLGAVELRNTLESAISMSLPPTLVFDYPTAAAIASYLATHLTEAAAETEVTGAEQEGGGYYTPPGRATGAGRPTGLVTGSVGPVIAVTALTHR